MRFHQQNLWILRRMFVFLHNTLIPAFSPCNEPYIPPKRKRHYHRHHHHCTSPQLYVGKRRHSVKLWKTFTDCFNCLPVAAIVDEKIFCMHGGLSPELNSMDQIRKLYRPATIPDFGMLCDLLWSDPDKDIRGWAENDRGVSFTFGADTVESFLKKHDLDLICRAHQVQSINTQTESLIAAVISKFSLADQKLDVYAGCGRWL